jgi:hypothetical protein
MRWNMTLEEHEVLSKEIWWTVRSKPKSKSHSGAAFSDHLMYAQILILLLFSLGCLMSFTQKSMRWKRVMPQEEIESFKWVGAEEIGTKWKLHICVTEATWWNTIATRTLWPVEPRLRLNSILLVMTTRVYTTLIWGMEWTPSGVRLAILPSTNTLLIHRIDVMTTMHTSNLRMTGLPKIQTSILGKGGKPMQDIFVRRWRKIVAKMLALNKGLTTIGWRRRTMLKLTSNPDYDAW